MAIISIVPPDQRIYVDKLPWVTIDWVGDPNVHTITWNDVTLTGTLYSKIRGQQEQTINSFAPYQRYKDTFDNYVPPEPEIPILPTADEMIDITFTQVEFAALINMLAEKFAVSSTTIIDDMKRLK